jgi:ParB family chromosome partitioning protein
MIAILRESKANQQEKISFRVEEIRKFFPKSYSAAKIQETILKLLADFQKKRNRDHSL